LKLKTLPGSSSIVSTDEGGGRGQLASGGTKMCFFYYFEALC